MLTRYRTNEKECQLAKTAKDCSGNIDPTYQPYCTWILPCGSQQCGDPPDLITTAEKLPNESVVRFSLEKLYRQLSDKSNWSNAEGWNASQAPHEVNHLSQRYCDWFGVRCCNASDSADVPWRQVESLTLFDNKLAGKLPGPIFDNDLKVWDWDLFPKLSILSLAFNRVTGTIPFSMSKATSLFGLWLHNNPITGPIPASFHTLTNLNFLRLENMNLAQTLPTALGDLTNLMQFFASNNSLTGSLPKEVGKLAKLSVLKLNSNFLNGDLPSELGNCTQLRTLDLSDNYFGDLLVLKNKSFVPESWGNLSMMEQFNVAQNKLYGTLPNSLNNMSRLLLFDASSNNISKAYPISIATFVNPILMKEARCLVFAKPQMCSFISSISLSNCSLQGSLDQKLMLATDANLVDLSMNNLTGQLPDCSGQTSFELPLEGYSSFVIVAPAWSTVNLQGNKFLNGPIPESWGEMNARKRGAWSMNFQRTNMSSPNQQLPKWLRIINATLSHGVHGVEGMQCHRVIGNQNNLSEVFLDGDYLGYKHCACAREFYGTAPHCFPCPKSRSTPELFCAGNSTHVVQGYWTPPVNVVAKQISKPLVVPCLPDYCCPNQISCSIITYTYQYEGDKSHNEPCSVGCPIDKTQYNGSAVCTKNRDPTSLLCSLCLPGYSAVFGSASCRKCPNSNTLYIVGIFAMSFLMLIVYARLPLRPSSRGIFVVTSFFFQTVGMVTLYMRDSIYAYPKVVTGLFELNLSPFPGICVVSGLKDIDKLWLNFSSPFILIFSFFAATGIYILAVPCTPSVCDLRSIRYSLSCLCPVNDRKTTARQRRAVTEGADMVADEQENADQPQGPHRRLIQRNASMGLKEERYAKIAQSQSSVFIILLLLCYSSFLRTTMELLDCIEVGEFGLRLYAAAEDLKCYDTQQVYLVIYLGVVLIPFPFVTELYRRHLKAKQERYRSWQTNDIGDENGGTDPGSVESAGSSLARENGCQELGPNEQMYLDIFQMPFKPQYPYWQSVTMFRRLVVISAHTFLRNYPFNRWLVINLLLIGILCSHITTKPFRMEIDNTMETVSLSSLTIFSILSTTFHAVRTSGHVSASTVQSSYIIAEGLLVLLVTVAFTVHFAYIWLWQNRALVKSAVKFVESHSVALAHVSFCVFALLVGSQYYIVQHTEKLHCFPPVTLCAVRYASASIIMIFTTGCRAMLYPKYATMLTQHFCRYDAAARIFMLALFQCTGPQLCIAYSETVVDSGLISLFSSLTPLFTAVIHLLFPVTLNEQHELRSFPALRRFGFVLCGFAGVGVVTACGPKTGAPSIGATYESGWIRIGFHLVGLLASLSYALGLVFGKRYVTQLMKLELYTVVVFQTLFAALQCAVAALATDYSHPPRPFGKHFHFPWNTQSSGQNTPSHLDHRGEVAFECFADVAGGLAGITIITCVLYLFMLNAIGPQQTSYVFYVIPLVGILESTILHTESWRNLPASHQVGVVVGSIMALFSVFFLSSSSLGKGRLWDWQRLKSPVDGTDSTATALLGDNDETTTASSQDDVQRVIIQEPAREEFKSLPDDEFDRDAVDFDFEESGLFFDAADGEDE
jgi:hypothetical protein